MKGQAWIEFARQEDAQSALKAMQGYRLYGKSMQVKYARNMSFRQAKLRGCLAQEKQRRVQQRADRKKNPRLTRRQLAIEVAKNPALAHLQNQSALALDAGLPNKTLFITGLPAEVKQGELSALFKRFPGFDEVRMVEQRPDVAFVEFATEVQAAQARATTDNLVMRPGAVAIRVIFARR